MKIFAVALLATVVLAFSGTSNARVNHCSAGTVRAFAAVTGDRLTGPGGIPARFDGAERLFSRRYNCTGGGAEVRRVSEGLYQVTFPGIHALAAVASATNSEGTAASVQHLDQDIFQVRLIGPQIQGNVLQQRDTGFVLIVY